MARAQDDSDSLRFSRRERERLFVALLLSLSVHLAIWGVYHAGDKLGWWRKWHPWTALPVAAKKTVSPKLVAAIVPPNPDPDVFVDVSHADADAPEKPRFYSNKNSHAANPDAANANVPKLNGRQTDAPKTEDAPKVVKRANVTTPETAPEPARETARTESRPQPDTLHPTPPLTPAETGTEAPKTPPAPGETELLKPNPNPVAPASIPAPPAPPPRPRTLKQALAQRDQIPGRQMQQAGGVPRVAIVPALDAKATPFGVYDAAIIEAVRQRWYDLLDTHQYAQDRAGKVTLRFKLKPDGTVIEMTMVENTVGDLLGYICQDAIEEAAPFAKWPPDMVREIGQNYRDLTFTFYYYSP
jgi:hypothetical protein